MEGPSDRIRKRHDLGMPVGQVLDRRFALILFEPSASEADTRVGPVLQLAVCSLRVVEDSTEIPEGRVALIGATPLANRGMTLAHVAGANVAKGLVQPIGEASGDVSLEVSHAPGG